MYVTVYQAQYKEINENNPVFNEMPKARDKSGTLVT